MGRVLAGELRERQHFLKTGLVQAHLLGAHEARHGVVAHLLQRAGLQAVVDGVEDQQRVGRLHVLDQVQPLGAAVDERHVFGELEAALQRFDAAHAKTFVGPEQVADAEHDDGLRPGGGVTTGVTGGFGRMGAHGGWSRKTQ